MHCDTHKNTYVVEKPWERKNVTPKTPIPKPLEWNVVFFECKKKGQKGPHRVKYHRGSGLLCHHVQNVSEALWATLTPSFVHTEGHVLSTFLVDAPKQPWSLKDLHPAPWDLHLSLLPSNMRPPPTTLRPPPSTLTPPPSTWDLHLLVLKPPGT